MKTSEMATLSNSRTSKSINKQRNMDAKAKVFEGVSL